MIRRSSGVSGPGLQQDARRDSDLADVVEERPELELFQQLRVEPSVAPTFNDVSVIQRVCDDVYSSFASSAFARAATVETKVASRFSKVPALVIASFAWCASPASSPT